MQNDSDLVGEIKVWVAARSTEVARICAMSKFRYRRLHFA